jgi:cytochrome c-type biogenesis protein CcmF
MTVAHLGLAIAVAGVTGASLWETESIQIMKPGDQVNVAGYDIAFVGVEDLRGPNYLAERGTFTVAKDGERIAILQPEKRRYVVSRQDTTEAAIRTTGIYDLYLVLGENNGKGGWTTRFYHKPLVPWLWIGSLVMVLGGLISLSDRRLRVGAPSRRPKRGKGAAAAPAAAE